MPTKPKPPAPVNGKREQNKAANRAAILKAAQRCFLERGYDAVTIRDVIRATHLASGTFYNYFPDKASLLRAILGEKIGELTEALHDVRSHAQTIEEFLYGAYLRVFTQVRADPAFYAMMIRNEPAIRAEFEDSVIGISLRSLRADLREAQARGVFPAGNADYLTAAMVGAGYELIRVLVDDKHADAEDAARFAARLFQTGIEGLRNGTGAALLRRGRLTIAGAAR